MVPDNSPGIPRAPGYSGVGLPQISVFEYGTVTPCGQSFQIVPLTISSARRRSYNPVSCVTTLTVWAIPLSIATTDGIIVIFSSYGYLDVSVPHVCLLSIGCRPKPAGCPIRTSAHLRSLAPPHGFSQLATSFFASESQGILHVPLSPFLFSLRK